MPKVSEADETIYLPKPGIPLGPDGQVELVSYNMSVFSGVRCMAADAGHCRTRKLVNAELSRILEMYGQPKSGIRAELRERLRTLANDRDSWTTYVTRSLGV